MHASVMGIVRADTLHDDGRYRRSAQLLRLWCEVLQHTLLLTLNCSAVASYMPLLLLQMALGVWAKYRCGHNVILAHAKTVQLYRQKYKPTQGGRISIALDGKWGYARSDSAADRLAAEHYMQMQYGWMADPIYFGDYPTIMRGTQVCGCCKVCGGGGGGGLVGCLRRAPRGHRDYMLTQNGCWIPQHTLGTFI